MLMDLSPLCSQCETHRVQQSFTRWTISACTCSSFEPGKEWFALKISEDSAPEVIPSLKGKTLREVLQPAFARHQIAFSDVQVYIRSSQSPLSYESDTYCLGGQHLYLEFASTDIEKKVRRSRSKSVWSRMRSFSMKSKGDHHHKVNERLFKDVHRWEARKSKTMMEIDDQIRRSNSVPNGPRSATNRKDMRQYLGHSSSQEESTSQQAVNGDIVDGTAIEFKGMMSRNRSSKVHALLGSAFTNTAQRTLEEQLQFFSVYGLPVVDGVKKGNEEETLQLKPWKDLVSGSDKISKRERNQQEAIWELICTELSYYQRVKAFYEVFYATLVELQKEKFLKNVNLDHLFANVRDVYELCSSFWDNSLYPLYKQCQQNKFRLHPFQIIDVFDMFEDRFYPYEEFCVRERECTAYLTTLKNESPDFKLYLEWCEKRPECNRMHLIDFIKQPRNRLAQYPLLLKRMEQQTDDDETTDRLTRLIDRMEGFLNQVNSALAHLEQVEMLHDIMSKLDGYSGIEIPAEYEKYVSDVLTLNLLSRMPDVPDDRLRQLFHEGDLRLKDSSTRDVRGYVFTDMLLLTTRSRKGGKVKIVRQPFRVDRIRCERLRDSGSFLLVYLSEYFLPIAFVHLQTLNGEQSKVWSNAIEAAKNAYLHAQQGEEVAPPNALFFRPHLSASSFSSGLSMPRDLSRPSTPSPFSSPGGSPPPRRTTTLPAISRTSNNRMVPANLFFSIPKNSPSLPSLRVSSPSHTVNQVDGTKQRRSFPETTSKACLNPQTRTQSVSESNLDQLIDMLPATPCDDDDDDDTTNHSQKCVIGSSKSADNLDTISKSSSFRWRSQTISYTPSPPVTRRRASASVSFDTRSCYSLDNLVCNQLETLQEEERKREVQSLSPMSHRKFMWHNQEITLNTSHV
ncbi:pleckstrin homology domain-containing family G member 5-like isoform X2 [Corticium candelabrum]|uniref:pleckstrin homology domain-containing family G member 5-like isoform X2 n=1 Tax=Corticium candelabrum TaxID=121492 RepID=UPI002E25F026|nr:pleckstrin homology domain-containing family G member 5-like isoform X2 [Corticium candelabrum]